MFSSIIDVFEEYRSVFIPHANRLHACNLLRYKGFFKVKVTVKLRHLNYLRKELEKRVPRVSKVVHYTHSQLVSTIGNRKSDSLNGCTFWVAAQGKSVREPLLGHLFFFFKEQKSVDEFVESAPCRQTSIKVYFQVSA